MEKPNATEVCRRVLAAWEAGSGASSIGVECYDALCELMEPILPDLRAVSQDKEGE